MNPHLEYLIEESSKICDHIIVRTNLVILLEKKYEHLMEVYARNKVEVVCSLPCITVRQRWIRCVEPDRLIKRLK